MKTLLNIIIWYLIFMFITGESDIMLWSTGVKVWSVIILILLLNSVDDQS